MLELQILRNLRARALTMVASAAMLAAVPLAASAATEIQVGATILAACTASGTSLNFGGSIDPLATSGPKDASSTLNVVCTSTTPYTVSLNAGTNAGGTSNFGNRTMKSGGNALPYQLYLDAARSQIWGDGNASSIHSGVGTGNAQTLTIYGRLPSLQNIVPGSYTDTVTLTISY